MSGLLSSHDLLVGVDKDYNMQKDKRRRNKRFLNVQSSGNRQSMTCSITFGNDGISWCVIGLRKYVIIITIIIIIVDRHVIHDETDNFGGLIIDLRG
jgi:hypothetical protein